MEPSSARILFRKIAVALSARNLLVAAISLALLGAGTALAGRFFAAGATFTAALIAAALAAFSSGRWKNLAFTVWIFAFACAALSFPSAFVSWGGFELRSLIVPLIQVIMFGMGTTLTFGDFGRVARMPVSVLIGFILQFTVMPIGGRVYAAAFDLEGPVAAGLILVGCCPGGVSSNVITYIAGGNVALSVTMTACSTLLSPVMTPLGMKLLAGRYVPIEAGPMMLSILYMILLPVLGGLLLSRYAGVVTRRMRRWMPFVSMLSICIIIAVTIALSRDELLVVGPALVLASVCHNTSGFLMGYAGGRALGLNRIDSRTVAIEVGMQNGGMATGLAFNVLGSERAAMASAVFGPYSAVAGSVLASFWRRREIRER